LFLDQCERLSPVIFGAGEPDARADAVHTLKGGARGIGAWRIADAAEALEAALRRGGPVDLGLIEDALPATRDAILRRLAPR
jgi:HPt (histidine-containing phosphotransfer) domain-containing protein